MSTATLLTPTVTDAGRDGLVHAWCECTPDVALCGADLTGLPYVTSWDPADACVVCNELLRTFCARCGAW